MHTCHLYRFSRVNSPYLASFSFKSALNGNGVFGRSKVSVKALLSTGFFALVERYRRRAGLLSLQGAIEFHDDGERRVMEPDEEKGKAWKRMCGNNMSKFGNHFPFRSRYKFKLTPGPPVFWPQVIIMVIVIVIFSG